MRRRIRIAPVLGALALAVPSVRAVDPIATLYAGQPVRQANISLGGWGSGAARESKDEVLRGSNSILVSTDGYFSGARIDFSQPVSMGRFATTTGAALRLALRFPNADASGSDGLAPGGGYFQGPPPGGPPGGLGRFPPAIYVPAEGAATPIATKNLRVVLMGGTVRLAAIDQPVDPTPSADGWVRVFVPLAAFRGAGGAAPDWSAFQLNRLLLFGDVPDSFYLGEIAVVQTDLTITDVSAGEEQEIFAGESAQFNGSANGSGLKFSWDFDAEDGIQEDAFGRNVAFRYRKPGNYTVTLIVSDPSGVMKPVTKTTVVRVNE